MFFIKKWCVFVGLSKIKWEAAVFALARVLFSCMQHITKSRMHISYSGPRARLRCSLDKMYSQPAAAAVTLKNPRLHIYLFTTLYTRSPAFVQLFRWRARARSRSCDKLRWVWYILHSASSLNAGDASSSRDDDLGTKLFPLFPSFRTRFIIFGSYLCGFSYEKCKVHVCRLNFYMKCTELRKDVCCAAEGRRDKKKSSRVLAAGDRGEVPRFLWSFSS